MNDSGGSANGGSGAVDLTNSAASEKVNAVFCVGIGFNDQYSRSYWAPADETRCIGATSAYVVAYTETNYGTVGDVYDFNTQGYPGVFVRAATGEYDIALASEGHNLLHARNCFGSMHIAAKMAARKRARRRREKSRP
jgi:hypothetical protein